MNVLAMPAGRPRLACDLFKGPLYEVVNGQRVESPPRSASAALPELRLPLAVVFEDEAAPES